MTQPKQNVYRFQPGVSHGKFGYYLPYSIGCLWAYVQRRPHIRSAFALGDMVFRRDHPDDVIARLDNPRVAGFSGYIWNWHWNLYVARVIKARWPECLIVFGGPQVPERENHTFFDQHGFIDIAVHAEGEATFLEILERQLDGGGLQDIPGTSIPGPGLETIYHPRRTRLDLDEYGTVSPFLDGTFDAILDAHPDVRWSAVMETNRGCPFLCTFCDWGSLIHAKIKRFDLEKVFAEIEWLGEREVDYVYIADANFGAFLERDGSIVDKLVEIKQRAGYPVKIAATWNKNSNKKTLELARRLDDAGLARGITLSVQSMGQETLKAIKRDNMKFSQLSSMFQLAEEAGLPAVTEMILGLPEETYDSWVDGTCQILELGHHSALTFYPAELLENAEMNTAATRQQYGLESALLANWAWEPDNLDVDGIDEASEIVTATRTLPAERYLDALMFSWLVLNLHVEGWTQFVARFVRRHSGTSYRRFYDSLLQWVLAHRDTFLHEEYHKMRMSWAEYFELGRPGPNAYRFESMPAQGYMQIHATQYALRADHGRTWNDVARFFDGFDHGLAPELATEVLAFQEQLITRFGRPFESSCTVHWNLWESLGAQEVKHEDTVYDFHITEPYDRSSMEDFLTKIYFRRRSGFGKMRVRRRQVAVGV